MIYLFQVPDDTEIVCCGINAVKLATNEGSCSMKILKGCRVVKFVDPNTGKQRSFAANQSDTTTWSRMTEVEIVR